MQEKTKGAFAGLKDGNVVLNRPEMCGNNRMRIGIGVGYVALCVAGCWFCQKMEFEWQCVLVVTLLLVVLAALAYYALKTLSTERKEELAAYRRMEMKKATAYERLMDVYVSECESDIKDELNKLKDENAKLKKENADLKNSKNVN